MALYIGAVESSSSVRPLRWKREKVKQPMSNIASLSGFLGAREVISPFSWLHKEASETMVQIQSTFDVRQPKRTKVNDRSILTPNVQCSLIASFCPKQ